MSTKLQFLCVLALLMAGLVLLSPSIASQGPAVLAAEEGIDTTTSSGGLAETAAATWYVSKLGNNQDGRSWTTAWNELNQINWSLINPGDTILLDGGATEMVYATSLVITKSGNSGAPITLRLADMPGRNGRVVIFGGRSTPLPYCGQASYTLPANVRDYGISVEQRAWIVIDGLKWSGIKVYGHGRSGVIVRGTSNNITIRNVEVYDNGRVYQSNGLWYPDLPGINLSGRNNTFERILVHDNGQDAFQSGGGVADFILRSSWLYQTRTDPTGTRAFNQCRHPDGIQIYNGGDQYGVLIEDSIIGPGFMQGLYLGAGVHTSNGVTQWATIHNVTLRHSLFHGASNANIMSGYESTRPPSNWRLENVTSHRVEGGKWHNVYLQGSGHVIFNSVFSGSSLTLQNTPVQTSGNCQWQTIGATIAQVVDPRFVSPNQANFALQAGSPCAGKGARVTSSAALLGSAPSMPTAAPPAPTRTPAPALPTPTPTRTPTPAPTAPPTGPLLSGLTWEAEAGVVSAPFNVSSGYVSQSIETTNPAQGGKVTYRFRITTPGSYVVKAWVNAPSAASDSVFLNIDGEPTNPGMIWDIGPTVGMQEKTASWRGAGSTAYNEFTPKVFDLDAGEHVLVVRGREMLVRLDRISLVPYTAGSLSQACYDFNANGVVDNEDVNTVAIRWRLTAANPDPDNNPATPNYDVLYDVAPDGVIDSLDINTVSAQVGSPCQ